MAVFLAQSFFDFRKIAQQKGIPQLVTISFSHYVELARWSLEYANIPFEEHGYAPGQHILPALSVRIPKSGEKQMAESANGDSPKPSPTGVPVMIMSDGSVLRDSWDIAATTSLAPIDHDLKLLLDKEVGPLTRKIVYFHLLKPKTVKIFSAMCTDGRHWFWRLLWFCGFGSSLVEILAKSFNSRDAAEYSRWDQELTEIFNSKLAKLLTEKKAKYLGGDKPGIADIALASLVAPVVSPQQYAHGVSSKYRDQQTALDPEYKAMIEKYQSTIVGKYCLDMYETHREVVHA